MAALAVHAPAALAQSGSEFDQYVPDLPEANSDKPLPDALGNGGEDDGSGDDGGAGDDEPVTPPSAGAPADPPAPDGSSPQALDELANKGAEGEAAARFAQKTKPSEPDVIRLADAGGASPGSSLLDFMGGPAGGMGVVLPLVLVLMLGAAVAYALRGRATRGKAE